MEIYDGDIVSGYKPKKLKPIISVTKAGTAITDYSRVSVKKNIDDISDSFDIDFIGDAHYDDLDPLATTQKEFIVTTGYKVNGTDQTAQLIKGYIDKSSQTLTPDGMKMSGTFLTNVKFLLPPYASKMTVDIRVINTQKRNISYIDFNDPSIVMASQLVGEILGAMNINYRYACYDYKIVNFHAEDYPLAIVKELIEFVGGYLYYNEEEDCIECLDKYQTNVGGVDFLYTDYNDIYEITESNSGNAGFFNAVRVYGTSPNEYIENIEVDEIEQIGQALEDDDQLYLVDTVSGTEKAPEEPYCDEPPKEKIEKKFYNIYLGFDIDPETIKIEGGSWNTETSKFEGAELIGYGTGFTSSESLSSDDGSLPMPSDLAPGEGKVSTPWSYEENPDKEAVGEFGLEAGVYSQCTIKGIVKDNTTEEPIASSRVTLDFDGTGQSWQWWRHTTSNAILKFWLAGSPGLGDGWTDVTSQYEQSPAPTGYPREMATGSGQNVETEGGAGVFSFAHCPISKYTATAEAIGYDEGELEIEFDATSFNFLATGNQGDDKTKKYKIVDTAYHIAVWAKKAKPIVSGNPPEDVTEEDIPEEDLINQIAVEVRSERGLILSGGRLIYGEDITDSRIISDEMAVIVGASAIFNSINNYRTRTFRMPHNPWLKKGHRVAIKSHIKGWDTPKEFIAHEINTEYETDGTAEKLKDVVRLVEVE